jgi:hypothetical protein
MLESHIRFNVIVVEVFNLINTLFPLLLTAMFASLPCTVLFQLGEVCGENFIYILTVHQAG